MSTKITPEFARDLYMVFVSVIRKRMKHQEKRKHESEENACISNNPLMQR
jgi:hypothetical protein